MEDADLRLDGNAVAGLMGEIFSLDVTVATTWCRGCGARDQVGELHAYVRAPGVVLRCPHCTSVLTSVVRGEGRYWVEFSGTVPLLLRG